MAFGGMAACKMDHSVKEPVCSQRKSKHFIQRSGDVISCDTCLQRKKQERFSRLITVQCMRASNILYN